MLLHKESIEAKTRSLLYIFFTLLECSLVIPLLTYYLYTAQPQQVHVRLNRSLQEGNRSGESQPGMSTRHCGFTDDPRTLMWPPSNSYG